MYAESVSLMLHKDAALKLRSVIDMVLQYGYGGVLVFDGFRPLEVQHYMHKFAVANKCEQYVSSPEHGTVPHVRGVAVDLTIFDKNGQNIEMGTDFDDFSSKAWHGADGISGLATQNRYMLLDIMTRCGWDFYKKEWWHYQLFNARQYRVLNSMDADFAILV